MEPKLVYAFLGEATRKRYASNRMFTRKEDANFSDEEGFVYTGQDGFVYRDRHRGKNPFYGDDKVIQKQTARDSEKVLLVRTRQGIILPHGLPIEDLITQAFLSEVHKHSQSFYRGPKTFISDRFRSFEYGITYENIEFIDEENEIPYYFHVAEEIHYNSTPLYRGDYQGVLLLDKSEIIRLSKQAEESYSQISAVSTSKLEEIKIA